MRILVVEDDEAMQGYLRKGLAEAGHAVDTSSDGADGLFLATTESYDLIVLDRMLPKLDGITALKALRGAGIDTPVLLLSALGEVDDRVAGLKAGGDDYLTKPFAFAEFLARVEVLARRRQAELPQTTLTVADLSVDLLARTATRAGHGIALQPREFALLEYLTRHAGQVVTRTMLLEAVWGYHFDPQTNVIDVHISRLRAKIDRDFEVPLLHTVRGAGYRLGLA
jgi:two-component system, OmpR family, response regulator